jgi:uncharacterized membrane protein
MTKYEYSRIGFSKEIIFMILIFLCITAGALSRQTT